MQDDIVIGESQQPSQLAIRPRQTQMAPFSASDISAQVQLIQQVMATVMKSGQHYGVIPGCGDKPSLLKPGAEKLCLTFRLRPVMDPQRGDIAVTDFGDGHREVMVYCHILDMSGVELATGCGSCSTMETKYRYRGGQKTGTGKAVPKEYWNLKNAGKMKEAQELIGGQGFGVGKVGDSWQVCELGAKMENPDIADTWNTVMKMAKKRAYVDGILSATAASDIFTQDLEDLPIEQTTPQAPVEPPTEQEKLRKQLRQRDPKPEAQKAAQAAQEPIEPNFESSIETLVATITEKAGSSSKGPYTKYGIKSADGTWYNTFDAEHAKVAKAAKEAGVPVVIEFTVDKYGNAVKTIAESREPGVDTAPDEG